MSTLAFEDRDPPTEAMGILEGVTTAGAPAALSLQHLHSLLTVLAPLRATYATAAVDRLRGLPLESRRALLPHVLHEHPDLCHEPRVRALADELGVDVERCVDRPDVVRWLERVSGVRSDGARDALDRIEHALATLATASVEIARARRKLVALDDTMFDVDALLERLLSREEEAARELSALARHVITTLDAAREATGTLLAGDDLTALEARASLPRWWPTPFREAALWSRARADQERRRGERTFDSAFARVLARLDREP